MSIVFERSKFMRALLDTNIIIHRENKRVSNYSVGHLFRWLDKLKYDKVVHPYSIAEIKEYRDTETQEVIAVKLESYEIIKTIKEPDQSFLDNTGIPEKTKNDRIDNCLLYELSLGRVDILITEDKGLHKKAEKIGLKDRVFSINAFISDFTAKYPSLIEYKMLAVKKTYFGNVDVSDSFFANFRKDYQGFDNWFASKCDEEAYICNTEAGKTLGFLYLKTEEHNENYSDIVPPFKPMRRLKVGTFKVESTGFRLGERFIKIIFDNALQRNVDEIYLTLFTDREELNALVSLIRRWGFTEHGIKRGSNNNEKVFVKKMKTYLPEFSCRENFPNIRYSCNKFILPIYPHFHTTLLPDSKLNNENIVDFLGREAHRYALQKIYISWASGNVIKSGDLIVFYRIGEPGTNKKYTSVVTTVGMVDEIIENISSETELLSLCQNRSVFSTNDLKDFWARQNNNLTVIKFIFVKSLAKRLTLAYLWEQGIVLPPSGPRPFTKLTDKQYEQILMDSQTQIEHI